MFIVATNLYASPVSLWSKLGVATVGVTVFGSACSLNLDGYAGTAPNSDVDASTATARDAGAGDDDAGASQEASVSGYRAAVLTDMPIGYWRLGEKSGTTAHDEVGAFPGSYTPTVVLGASGAIEGDPDTAVTFDGREAAISIPGSALSFAGVVPFSVEAWAKPTILISNYHYVFSKEDGNPRQGWGLFVNDTEVLFERIRDGNFDVIGMSSPLALNVWSHVVVTFDGTNAFFYINGAQKPARQWTSPLLATASNLSIDSGGAGGMVGSLDEIAIYSHAIPAERVVAHYNARARR